ncbi:MAG: hypothetical protein V4649_14290 [Bacteroidota bacterium]
MPYFSSFWKKHYPTIKSCCTFYPLQDNAVHEPEFHRFIDFIDTAWMMNEELKWVGWDLEGWYIWIDPGGLVYRFAALKRNDAGKKQEARYGKLRLNNDGSQSNVPVPAGAANRSKYFYEWELEQLSHCGFCPSGSTDGVENKGGMASTPKEKGEQEKQVIPSWQEYAGGDGITDTQYGPPPAPDYGNPRQYIPDIPYVPPIPMTPGAPTPEQMDPWPVPPTAQPPAEVISKMAADKPAVDTDPVINSPAVPWERRKIKYLVQPDEDFDYYNPEPGNTSGEETLEDIIRDINKQKPGYEISGKEIAKRNANLGLASKVVDKLVKRTNGIEIVYTWGGGLLIKGVKNLTLPNHTVVKVTEVVMKRDGSRALQLEASGALETVK